MPTEVILPKVDMDMATGRISAWHVAEGQAVRKGDLLFEIETDKAAMEIDSPADGVIRDITGKAGEDIAVGTVVAWIYAEGEVAGSSSASAPSSGPSGHLLPAGERKVAATPAPSSPLRGEGGSGSEPGEGSAIRATPLARRLARENGIDLTTVSGSGPHGRITRADIEAADANAPSSGPSGHLLPVGEKNVAAAPAPSSPLRGEGGSRSEPGEGTSDAAILKLFPEGSYEIVPHDAMRRTIARRLVEAKSTVPHFYLTADCDIDALLKLRGELNAAGAERYKLSVNDFVVKAYAAALRAVPDANVSWTEGGMLRHANADVGVAVSVPGGLITPIVRHAEEKTLSAISNEIRDLAERARNRKLKPDEYQGGTGAVSNLGMYGVRDFAAVINPPHATILAAGAGERRAVVGQDDAVRVATMMTVTLSTDHRAVDGALGAQLLAAFKRYIENPATMLV